MSPSPPLQPSSSYLSEAASASISHQSAVSADTFTPIILPPHPQNIQVTFPYPPPAVTTQQLTGKTTTAPPYVQASTSSSLFPPDPPKKQSQSKCIQVSLSQSTRDQNIQVDTCDDPDPYTIEELNKDFPVTKYFPEDIQEN